MWLFTVIVNSTVLSSWQAYPSVYLKWHLDFLSSFEFSSYRDRDFWTSILCALLLITRIEHIMSVVLHLFFISSWLFVTCLVISLTHDYILKEPIWEKKGCQPACCSSRCQWSSTDYDLSVAWRGRTLFLMLNKIELPHHRMHLAAVPCIHSPSSHEHWHLSLHVDENT